MSQQPVGVVLTLAGAQVGRQGTGLGPEASPHSSALSRPLRPSPPQTDYFHLFICVAIVAIYGDDVIEQQLATDQMLLHFANLAMHMNGELVLRKVSARRSPTRPHPPGLQSPAPEPRPQPSPQRGGGAWTQAPPRADLGLGSARARLVHLHRRDSGGRCVG